jgi:hypothetical protein
LEGAWKEFRRGQREENAVVTEAPSAEQHSPFSLRAIILGLALIALLCIVTPYTHLVLKGSEIAANHLPAGVVMILLMLARCVNPWLRRRHPRWALRRGEIVVISIMMFVTAAIPGRNFLAYVLTVPSGATYYATPENKWSEQIQPYLPKWAAIGDQQAVKQFFEGLHAGEKIPWRLWLPQMTSWAVFMLLFIGGCLCLALVFRRQWIEAERLVFPLAQVPLDIIGRQDELAGGEQRLATSLMLLGAGLVIALHSINALHEYLPALPSVRLTHIRIVPDDIAHPWNILTTAKIYIYPSVIGIAYLLSSEVGLSMWLFFVVNRTAALALAMLGMNLPTQQGGAGWDIGHFFRNQEVGAYISLTALLIWDMHRRLGPSFQRVAPAEARQIRWALIGFAICASGLIIWQMSAGMSPFFACLSVAIYFMIALGLTRLVSQSGVMLAAWSAEWLPSDVITQNLGNPIVPPRSLTMIYMEQAMFINDRRTIEMPFLMNSLKMAHSAGLRTRPLAVLIMASVCAAMALSLVVGLKLGYSHGALDLRYEASQHIPTWNWGRLMGNFANKEGPNKAYISAVGIGAVLMSLLTYLHRNVSWWRLSPIGYLMGRSYGLGRTFAPTFIGWTANVLASRYGGLRLYRRLRPFFIGLIIGEFVAVVFWLAADGIIGVKGHDLFPVSWPES